MSLFNTSCTNAFTHLEDTAFNIRGHCVFVSYIGDCWGNWSADDIIEKNEAHDIVLLIHPENYNRFKPTFDKLVDVCEFSSVGDWANRYIKKCTKITPEIFQEYAHKSWKEYKTH
jgi:hypothetical protein